MPADLRPAVRSQRLESLEQPLTQKAARRGLLAQVRRVAVVGLGLGGIGLAYLALQKIGINSLGHALINSSPAFVLAGLATMCAAMVMRGFAWHAILKAALPQRARVRLIDALQRNDDRGVDVGDAARPAG